MEFSSINTSKFDINKPPQAYPDSYQDRDGNYEGPDNKDYANKSDNHESSDVDSSRRAKHHTLGTARNQASPGDHIHDGVVSKKTGAGLGLVLTGSKGGNVALANLITMLKTVIEFTDSTT
jgi:hypothetical protein